MSKGKAKPADVYRPQMEAANTAAAAPAPQVQKVDEYTSKLWDMYSGKTPFELSNMPNAGVLTTLSRNAMEQTDRGRMGRGLMLGDGSNSAQIAAIAEQDNQERQIAAKGQLEDRVADTFQNLPQQMIALGGMNQQNRDNAFNRSAQMYGMEINKPKEKKWWEYAIEAGTQVAASALTGGLA